MAQDEDVLKWSSRFTVAPPICTPRALTGDKIILPQSALEQLLAAAPIRSVAPSSSRQYTNTFDPFNPHTFDAEARARELASDRQQQLPHPLTFRLVNPQNGRVVFAGIREFSAGENEIGLSALLREALGIDDSQFLPSVDYNGGDDGQQTAPPDVMDLETPAGRSMSTKVMESHDFPSVTVHAKQLPKGTYVRLRPLEAGYDPEDWKSLLERYLRENFTTLTVGELLSVPGVRDQHFRFLVDKVQPEGDGICVVDTDLEVDIEALTEDQARETLRRRLEKASRPPSSAEGSSIGGTIAVGDTVTGQVIPGEYVDYDLPKWNSGDAIDIELEVGDDGDADLLVSPLLPRQRSRPREDEYVLGDFSSGCLKRIRLQPTNVELEHAEALYISVHPFSKSDDQNSPLRYSLRVLTRAPNETGLDANNEPHSDDPDDVQCKNCLQWVPQRTLFLHENFCLRNNVLCSQCGSVFQKRSPEWENHWHCPHDSYYGNDALSKVKHDSVFHKKYSCLNCAFDIEGLPGLAQHRTTVCPAKPILCQFCHLVVPQQGESDPDIHDPEVLLSGLTPHEVVDGGRTTECHLCNKIIRLRDMKTHLRHHDLERLSRPAPRICLNQNCGRTIDSRGNDSLGLCSICFGPLYVDTYDPEGKSLRRRIERRYLSQMITGCGKPWCQNEYCKTGKQTKQSTSNIQPATMSAADILNVVRPLIDGVKLQPGAGRNTAPFYFCTDQASQQRRTLAEMITAEGVVSEGRAYDLEWCVAAVEAAGGDLDKAKEWLSNWAPAKGESVNLNRLDV